MSGASFSVVQEVPPLLLLPPAADAAGRAPVIWRNLSNCARKLSIICLVNQGNAATVTFSPLQAKDSSGTSSKALPAVPLYTNLDLAGGDTFTVETPASTFTTDAALKSKLVVWELEPGELDLAGGYSHLGVQTSASNVANITAAWLQMSLKYKGLSAPLSSLV